MLLGMHIVADEEAIWPVCRVNSIARLTVGACVLVFGIWHQLAQKQYGWSSGTCRHCSISLSPVPLTG